MQRTWRAALALAVLWLTAGFAVGAAHAESTPQAFASRLVELINQARTQHGLRALTVTSGTSTVAANWTEHLDRAQALSHNPDLGPQLESHGSPDWTMYGENVGDGPTSSADTLFNAYMNSPEHRDNILGSKYRYLGIGVVFDGSTAWNTLDFVDQYGTSTAHAARPSSRPRPAAPKPVVSHTPAARPVVAAPPAPRPTPHRVVPAPRPRPVQKPSVQGLALASEPLAAVAAAPSLPAPIRLPHPDRAPVPVLIATAAVVAGVGARYLVELRVLRVSPRVA